MQHSVVPNTVSSFAACSHSRALSVTINQHTPPPPGVFNWVVSAINAKLDMGKKGSGRFIAILDIYGFEQFQVNR